MTGTELVAGNERERDVPADIRPWASLDPAEQTRLRIDYGRYLEQLPPTCSLEEKNRRFARWLAERGITFGTTQ